MSQEGIINVVNNMPSIPITFTTESGTATPAANNINFFAGSNLTSTGSGSTVTYSLTGLQNHSLVVGSGSSAFTNLGVATNGQLPIGSTGADPVLANLTAGTGITITNGAGTITIAATGGSVEVETLTGNSGGSVSPTAGNINTIAAGSITIVGNPGTSTLTTQLTGLTNHAVLVGAGTATITNVGPTATTGQVLQSQGSTTDPAFSTATYPATTTINQILYSSAANTVTGLTTANNGVLTTGTSGIPVITALASNGQLIIGSGSGAPAASTLTAGTGITITNAANSVTITATGAGFPWTDENTSFNAVSGNGYFVTGAATATLPASPNQGDTISFIVDTASTLTVTGNTGQEIRIGAAVSAAAGTAVNHSRGDSLTLIYRSSDTTWLAREVIGTWVVT